MLTIKDCGKNAYFVLDDFQYRRDVDFWKRGDSFIVPSRDDLMCQLVLVEYASTIKFPAVDIMCKDGIERRLFLNTLRKSVCEFNEQLMPTGRRFCSTTKFYQQCSLAHNAQELFEILASYAGKTIEVVDVQICRTLGRDCLITKTIPCFEVVQTRSNHLTDLGRKTHFLLNMQSDSIV